MVKGFRFALAADKSNVGSDSPLAFASTKRVHLDYEHDKVEAFVDVYHTKQAADSGKSPVWGGIWTGYPADWADTTGKPAEMIIPSGPINVVTIQTWLKTLPEFSGAVDVS